MADISLIRIQEKTTQRNINFAHSLFYLWNNFKQLNKYNHLIPCYTSQEEHTIGKVIKFFNDRDSNSTTFRYPFSKQGKPIIIEPIDLNKTGIAPELGAVPPTIIRRGDKVCIVKKGVRYLDQTQKLFDAIELLFQFYGE